MGVFLLKPLTAIFLWILTLFSLKRIYYFYLHYLIEKIIYRFKNNIYCFWILKSCVKNTIFSLYFYFEFFVLYFCIYISISIFPFFFSIILVLYFCIFQLFDFSIFIQYKWQRYSGFKFCHYSCLTRVLIEMYIV